MSSEIKLKGITWNHSRGFTPLIASSQRFSELYNNVSILWDKRTLQEFADYPIHELVKDYDLLIIDHPWVGYAAKAECVLPLDKYINPSFLADQEIHSVGNSHLSYYFDSHQWALAIDAATPVASFRKDLIQDNYCEVPTNWDELLAMATLKRVAVPSIPIDLLMSFYSFCIGLGTEPFVNTEEIIDRDSGIEALETMRSLWCLIDPKFFSCNPIQVAEIMTTTNDYWYCPFAYGYSNYSRRGYAKNLLHYTDLIEFGPYGNKLKTTLGGTGIAVSSYCKNPEHALAFTEWVASPILQSTLYVENGGQPGHRSAWEDPLVNQLNNDYFKNTIAALDRSYTRPRYKGYLDFQDRAGVPLQEYLKYGGNPLAVLEKMNSIYQSNK